MQGRLEHIDALRGFALLGILLLHAHGNFGVSLSPSNEILELSRFDNITGKLVSIFVRNKAFAVFSIIFGFSFFLQIDRSSKKGKELNLFYARRLFLLLIIGYVNAMVFLSDILTKYAIMGFILLFLYRLNQRFILILAVLLLLQIPEWLQTFQSLMDVDYQLISYRNNELWSEIAKINATGSFLQVIKMNMWQGLIELWKLNITSGRLTNILGYFLLGFLLGKSRLLEDINKYRKVWIYMLVITIHLYLLLRYANSVLPFNMELTEASILLLQSLVYGYMNFLVIVIIMSLFVLLYQISLFQSLFNILRPYGRMSLTSYIFQSFLGVFLFYGFGLGLYNYLGSFLSLVVGVFIFIFLLLFSNIWFIYFRFGPVEYIWRALTYRTWDLGMRKES
jgi:uncharacterized protein